MGPVMSKRYGSRLERFAGRRLLITTALAGGAALASGFAQAKQIDAAPLPPRRPTEQVAAAHPGPTKAFDIPGGALAPALRRWADISRVQVLASTHEMRGLRCEGLAGAYAPEGALRALLTGTGLGYEYTRADVVAIVNPQYAQLGGGASSGEIALDTISVEGGRGPGQPPPTGVVGQAPPAYAGGQVGAGTRLGVLGNRSVFDTPFNTTSYTEKLNRDQQSRSLADVVANDPSVRSILPRGSIGEQFFIRGFRVFPSDIAFDGLFGLTDFRRQPIEGIERVEVLKGPAALLFGVPALGSVGGTINLIPKRAPEEDLTRVTLGFASASQLGTHVDVGRRFGMNKEWGVRFNGVYRDGRSPVRYNELGFSAATLGLDYRGERFRVSGDFSYHEQLIEGIQNLRTIRAGFQVPRAPRGTINVNQPWEFYDERHILGSGRAEFDLTDQTTLYAALGRSRTKELSFTGSPQIINPRGDALSAIGLFPAAFYGSTAEIGLRSQFETGPISHRVSLSAAELWRESRGVNTAVGPSIASNVFDPIVVPERSTAGLSRQRPLTSRIDNRGFAFADTLSIWNETVALTAGGRFQEVGTRNFSGVTGLQTSRDTSGAFSPAAALVVKPVDGLSLYANYVEGLQAGSVAPVPAINAGEVTNPFVTKQIEVGAKYDFGPVGVSFAAFEITQPSAFLSPATNRFGVDGEQRNRGIELNVFGEPLPGLRALGGVTFLDGELTRTVGGLNNGRTAPGVPDVQLNLYAEYDLPASLAPGLTLTGRVIHTTRQFVDPANTQPIPSWTRVDLGVRYLWLRPEGKPVTLRAAVENAFGTNYYASTGGGFLTQGSPRTYLVSATVDF